jgi:hypothetical protein
MISAEVDIPKSFYISQNYPNPFNPATRIDYQLPVDSRVRIELFNIIGEKIGDLINDIQPAGNYSVSISSISFKHLSSGVYFYRMTAFNITGGNNFVNVKKMIMLK